MDGQLASLLSNEARLGVVSPVVTLNASYFALVPKPLGDWGDWKGED
jgi:hypothetical protein